MLTAVPTHVCVAKHSDCYACVSEMHGSSCGTRGKQERRTGASVMPAGGRSTCRALRLLSGSGSALSVIMETEWNLSPEEEEFSSIYRKFDCTAAWIHGMTYPGTADDTGIQGIKIEESANLEIRKSKLVLPTV